MYMNKDCGLMSNGFGRFLNNFSPVISQQWYKTAKDESLIVQNLLSCLKFELRL